MNATRRLALAGCLILLVVVAQTSLHVSGDLGIGSYTRLAAFVVLWGFAGAIYAAAVWMSLRTSGPKALWVVIAVAAALRIAPLAAPPFLSTDVYRYVWDGRVQNAGINPYCCIPSAPALQTLQESAIYPHINRSDYAPTIYPPAAQMVFAVVAAMSQTVLAMKLAMVAAEVVGVAAMVALLREADLPPARVLIYAWNPAVVWEYSGNGHVDALAIGFTGLALLAAARRRPAASGVALAAATLTKFLPAAIGPALWALSLRPAKFWIRLPLAFVVAVVAAYAGYASVGLRVFGFLPGYAHEEGLGNGSGIFGLQLLGSVVPLPSWAPAVWLLAAALIMALISVRILLRRSDTTAEMGADALLLSTGAIVAVSPHYAWYFGGLAYLSCLAAWPSVIWLTIACVALYLDRTHETAGWSSLVYGPFVILAARDLVHWRARHRITGSTVCP